MPQKVQGKVQAVDATGNLVTDISVDKLAGVTTDDRTRVVCDEHETLGVFPSIDGQPEMTFVALLGSSGKLELAIVGDNAALMLGIEPGTPVTVSW